jgi:hypothetical protein
MHVVYNELGFAKRPNL